MACLGDRSVWFKLEQISYINYKNSGWDENVVTFFARSASMGISWGDQFRTYCVLRRDRKFFDITAIEGMGEQGVTIYTI